MNLISPVENPIVTSPYGPRVNPINKWKTQNHEGIDFISENLNREVFAITEGTVIYDKDDYDHTKRWSKPNTAGNLIIVKHVIDRIEYYVRYLHLGENYFNKGDDIWCGDLIGEYGDYGRSAGAHLHIDFWTMNWQRIDPTPIFRNYGVVR